MPARPEGRQGSSSSSDPGPSEKCQVVTLRRVETLLRSRHVIVGELAGLTAAMAVGAAIPQVGVATPAELDALREASPTLAAIVAHLRLDAVFSSPWFMTVLAISSLSLTVVATEQVRRLARTWRQTPRPSAFKAAPFSREFERPARGAAATAPTTCIRTTGRLGLAGAAVFHVGLLLVVVAGMLRSLFNVDAAVDLLEGETLAPGAAGWGPQSSGALARPIALDVPVVLEAVQARRYSSGALEQLSARLRVGDAPHDVAINSEVDAGRARLYVAADHGPSVLVEWRGASGEVTRRAVLLKEQGGGTWAARAELPGTVELLARVRQGGGDERPRVADVRLMRAGGLLATGLLGPGDALRTPAGDELSVAGLPLWLRLRASRDPALGVAFAGFAFVLAGAVLIFGVVKVDTCVLVTPAGERERVFVALKASRFAPLFEDRFRRLVEQEGGG